MKEGNKTNQNHWQWQRCWRIMSRYWRRQN